jgi:2-methylcitrate dehydratase PrpD
MGKSKLFAAVMLGQFAARHGSSPLETRVAKKAAHCLLDALGLAVAARNEKTVQAASETVTDIPKLSNSSQLWISSRRAVLSEAVFLNALATHAHFQDDMDGPSWTHPASLIVPAAVCAGEQNNVPLEHVLRGIAVGYAALAWIGAREKVARGLIGGGFRTSPTLGTIGAAAAAAAVMQLDESQAAHAVAIASSVTGGILDPVRAGSDEWRIQNGLAARAGFLAAQMASRNVKGALDALDGGFLRAYTGLRRKPREWSEAPSIDSICDSYVKPWPTVGANLAPCSVAKVLFDEGLSAARISSGRIEIWKPYVDYPGTTFAGPFVSPVQAQSSTSFCVSAMLMYGELNYDTLLRAGELDDVSKLASAFHVQPFRSGGPLSARLRLELSDGKVVTRTADATLDALIRPDEAATLATFVVRLTTAGCAKPRIDRAAYKILAAAREAPETWSVAETLENLMSTRPEKVANSARKHKK